MPKEKRLPDFEGVAGGDLRGGSEERAGTLGWLTLFFRIGGWPFTGKVWADTRSNPKGGSSER